MPELQLDWTTVIGLLGLAQAAMLCAFLALFHPKRAETWLLVGLILSIIIALGHDILLHSRLAVYLPQMIGYGPFSAYVFGPLVYLFARRLLWPDRPFKVWDALHALPFVIHFVSRWSKYTGSAQPKLDFLLRYYETLQATTSTLQFDSSMISGFLMFYGHRFVYFGVVMVWFYRYRRQFDFAVEPRRRLASQLGMALTVYCAGWLCLQIMRFIPATSVTIQDANLMINALALSLVVILLALLLFRHPFDEMFSPRSTEKYQQSRLDEHTTEQVMNHLNSLLENDKLYCDPDLKLPLLAEKSGFSTQQISQAVNRMTGASFNDWLNQYRLADIQHKLVDPDNKKADIQQLALDSGFNSKATFYRVFKDKLGMTPSEYRKQAAKPLEPSGPSSGV